MLRGFEMQEDMFQEGSAVTERDQALHRVATNSGSWMLDALIAICRISTDSEVTGEDIRLNILERVGMPHHHNAWGALIKSALKQGVLIPTGEYRAMKTRKSHARKTPVYRIKG